MTREVPHCFFLTHILHVIHKAIQNSEKDSCSTDNSSGKVRWLFYIKSEPQRGPLLVGGEGQFESDNIFVKDNISEINFVFEKANNHSWLVKIVGIWTLYMVPF
jgi:hypothetical protein